MRQKAELERKVAEIVYRLPPMPENIERLLREATGTRQNLKQMVQIVAKDPGLCTELLHLANTCCDRTAGAETIEDAVSGMGLEPLIHAISAGTYAASGASHRRCRRGSYAIIRPC